MPDSPPLSSFGYRDVAETEKEGLVRGVFSSVARRYDLMNDLMSAGVHRLWKDAMIDWLDPRPGRRYLDVAGGTGDIAFRIAALARARGGEADITVCDINRSRCCRGLADWLPTMPRPTAISPRAFAGFRRRRTSRR